MASPYETAALNAGLPPALAAYMPRYVQIESGGNPNARTGSYSGLLQMGPDEIRKYGGNGLDHGAAMYADKYNWFAQKYGRDPSPTELYMINQQGQGGLAAHMANPEGAAWQNMYSTAEGQAKGQGWAKKAIWGNVPDDVKAQYPGGVDTMTSKDFMNMWQSKVERGQPFNPTAPAQQAQQAPWSPAGATAQNDPTQAAPAGGLLGGLLPTSVANALAPQQGGGGGGILSSFLPSSVNNALAPSQQPLSLADLQEAQQQQQAIMTPQVPQLQAPQINYYRPQLGGLMRRA